MRGGVRLFTVVAIFWLVRGGVLHAEESRQCSPGREGEYVVWNFDRRTAALFDPGEIADELAKIQVDAARRLGSERAPSLQVSLCRNDALLTQHSAADFGDFLLAVVTAEGKDFEVRIVPYIVEHERPRLITHWKCAEGGPIPSVNAYRSQIRAYAYAALALAEIRRVESSHDPCLVRHAQFFLERALSDLATTTVTTAGDESPAAALQLHLEEKRQWLRPLIEAAAKTASRCGMPPESSRLSELLPEAS